MRRSWNARSPASCVRGLIALVVAAVALAACGGDPELPSGPPGQPLFGFNDNAVRAGQVSAAEDARLTAAVGGEVSRLTFDWRYAEREPDVYDFREYDEIYGALRREGVKPLWIVMFAPSWAWEPGIQCAGDCRFPPGRRAERHWREIVALIARRYPESAGIELWNEPNLTAFWKPRPDPRRYLRLLKQGYRAVKRVRPRLPVALGGLNNIQVTDELGNISLADFTRALYDGGAHKHMDALSFHPYPAVRTEPVFVDSVLQVLDVQEEYGDLTPLWITEIGATTSDPSPDRRWTERDQADELVDLYDQLARVPGVEMVLVHTLLEPRPGEPGPGYGILRRDGSPKPAACALARRLRAEGIRC